LKKITSDHEYRGPNVRLPRHMASEYNRAITQLFTKEIVMMDDLLILTFPNVELRITAHKRKPYSARKARGKPDRPAGK
jgi:hypothetical protein